MPFHLNSPGRSDTPTPISSLIVFPTAPRPAVTSACLLFLTWPAQLLPESFCTCCVLCWNTLFSGYLHVLLPSSRLCRIPFFFGGGGGGCHASPCPYRNLTTPVPVFLAPFSSFIFLSTNYYLIYNTLYLHWLLPIFPIRIGALSE